MNQEDREHKIKLLVEDPVAMAKQRLIDFGDSIDHPYPDLMASAKNFLETGEYEYGPEEGGSYGKFEGQGIYDTFWEDYELVTGTTVDESDKHSFFTCSC